MQGTIIRWDNERGFGFVKEEITGTEIFIHISTLNIRNPAPEIGEKIEFETTFNEQKGKTEVKQATYLDKNRKHTSTTSKAKPHALHRKQNRSNQYHKKEKQPIWLWIAMGVIAIAIIFALFKH